MTSGFNNKLVAVINKTLEAGKAMNALAHMSIGLGASLENNLLLLTDYTDSQNNKYPHISSMPYIILRAKSSEIRKLVIAVREHNIAHTVFLNTMTEGTYLEQLKRTNETNESDLIYYGCTLFGDFQIVTELTKKFSLWL